MNVPTGKVMLAPLGGRADSSADSYCGLLLLFSDRWPVTTCFVLRFLLSRRTRDGRLAVRRYLLVCSDAAASQGGRVAEALTSRCEELLPSEWVPHRSIGDSPVYRGLTRHSVHSEGEYG